MNPDSDPRTIIVTHGAGARVCIEAILDLTIDDEHAARAISGREARATLLAIAGKLTREEQIRASRLTKTRFSTTAFWLYELGLVKQIHKPRKAGPDKFVAWEPDWLGISKHTHNARGK